MKKGYTLVELLVVVTIMGIFLLISIPNAKRWLAEYRLRAATVSMMNHFRAARMLAIFKGVTHQIQLKKFDEGNYYQVVEGPGTKDQIVMTIGRVVFPKRFGGVVIKQIPKGGRINFYPRGTSDNETIYLENSDGTRIKIVTNQFGRVRSEEL